MNDHVLHIKLLRQAIIIGYADDISAWVNEMGVSGWTISPADRRTLPIKFILDENSLFRIERQVIKKICQDASKVLSVVHTKL